MSSQHLHNVRRSLSYESNSRIGSQLAPNQDSTQSSFPPTPEVSPNLLPIYPSRSHSQQHYNPQHHPSFSSSASTNSDSSSSSSYQPSNSPPVLSLPPSHLPPPLLTTSISTTSSSRAPTPSFRSVSTSASTAKGKKTSGGSSTTKQMRESNRKANHSVIEKRRREKINAAMDNLKELTNGEALRASKEKHEQVSEDNLDDGDGGEPAGGKGEFKLDVLEKTVAYIKSLHAHIESLRPHPPASLQTQRPSRIQPFDHRDHPQPTYDPPSPPRPPFPSISSSSFLSSYAPGKASNLYPCPHTYPTAFSSSSSSPTFPFTSVSSHQSQSLLNVHKPIEEPAEDASMSSTAIHTVDAATMLLSLASPELRGVVGSGIGGGGVDLVEWRL